MNYITRLCIALLIVLSATTLHAQQATTPLEFSDRISDITDSLFAYGQAWGSQYKVIIQSRSKEPNNVKEFSTLKPHRRAMSAFVDHTVSRLKAMPDVKNSKEFRMAMIHFMEYEKKMVDMAFAPIEQLRSTVTDAELNKVLEQLRSYSAAESGELQKVAATQEAYADSNGFAIEGAEEAKKP